MKKLLISLFLLVFSISLLASETVNKDREKLVVFYPTYGYQVETKPNIWRIPMRLWGSEDLDAARALTLKAARKVIEQKIGIDDLTKEQKKRFIGRAQDFLRDSESNIEISIKFKNDPKQISYRLWDYRGEASTDRNGVLKGMIELTDQRAKELFKAQNSSNGWLSFFSESKKHFGEGKIRLIPAEGISVISDIDDTIKVSNIPLGSKEVLNNTFFAPFKDAPGMSKMYKDFPEETAFHYVSGGPWQLYRPLSNFLIEKESRFPAGSFHMKNVRTNLTESESYDDISKLISGGATQAQKIEQISRILRHFPKRRFILIGDSGEYDPEVFSEIRKSFPEKVDRIIIRDVKGDIHSAPERFVDMELIPTSQDMYLAPEDLTLMLSKSYLKVNHRITSLDKLPLSLFQGKKVNLFVHTCTETKDLIELTELISDKISKPLKLFHFGSSSDNLCEN